MCEQSAVASNRWSSSDLPDSTTRRSSPSTSVLTAHRVADLLRGDDLRRLPGGRTLGRPATRRCCCNPSRGSSSSCPASIGRHSSHKHIRRRHESIRPKQPRLRLNPESYERLCRKVLQRDGWRCQSCGILKNLQVHHKEFRSQSGGVHRLPLDLARQSPLASAGEGGDGGARR